MKRVWPILLASTIGLAILFSLGVWQVQRLHWKEALIAELDSSMAAPPVSMQVANGKAYAKVMAKGRFVEKPALRMLAANQGGPAWQLIQGFVTENGEQLLVVRGKQPHGVESLAATRDTIEIMGHILPAPRAGLFDVENDVAANRWTWWDLPAMAAQFGFTNSTILALNPGSPGTEGLFVDPPKANLRNNHLGYAITWFGLALVLVVMTVLFVRTRMKEG